MKINARIALRNKSKNEGMGFLPPTLDRSFFQTRVDKIKALPLIAQLIVLEFETNFVVTIASGNSFGAILEAVVNKFENQFKTITCPSTTSSSTAAQIAAMSILDPTGSILGDSFFGYAGNLPFLRNFFNLIGCSKYTVNNYAAPFTVLHLLPYTVDTYFGTFDKVTYATIGSNQRTTANRVVSVGTTGITVDLWTAMGLKSDRVNHPENFVGGWDGYWYTGMTPTDFFAMMRAAIVVIKWLESENNDFAIVGNVDGVKVASYEKTLNDQLVYINGLSDLVANANIQLITDGQAKKDALTALITAKQAEIADLKFNKRKNITINDNLTNNYTSIINDQKNIITKSLTGV